MDIPSALTSLILFLLALALSGLLSGIKTVLGFYQKQNLDLALSADSPRFRNWIDGASRLWKTPGFFEALSLGRFILETFALFFGSWGLYGLFPIGWGWAFVL